MEIIRREDLSETQEEILDAVDNGIRCIGANTGTGKSLTVLYASAHCKSILVVVPKMLRDVKSWETDFAKTVGVDFTLTVLSKEDFKKHHETLPRYDVVAFDEAGDWLLSGPKPNLGSERGVKYIKSSGFYEAAYTYLRRVNPDYIFLIDATLIAGKPLQLWAALDILGKLKQERLASHQAFVNMFYSSQQVGYTTRYSEKTKPMPEYKRKFLKKDEFVSEQDSEEAGAKLLAMWKKVAIFVDDDAKIPPIEKDIIVIPDDEHKKIIAKTKRDYRGSGGASSRQFAIENGHLSDVDFDDDAHTMTRVRHEFDGSKNQALLEIAKEKKQVLIFSTFTAQQNKACDALISAGFKGGIINGETSPEDRQILITAFNNKSINFIVAQSAICQGYNTPDCDTVVRLSPPIRAAHLQQQYGRIDRKSNYKQNYIYNIILKGGVDEASFDRVKRGEDLNDMAYE